MNRLTAQHLRQLSTLYQIQSNTWRSRAFTQAADGVENFGEPITVENVTSIAGVGKGISRTVLEYQDTGSSLKFNELAQEIDPQCLTMLVVKNVGPKTAWKFYQDGIKNFDELVIAWKAGKLDPRFDEAMRQAIDKKEARLNKYTARKMADTMLSVMKQQDGVIRAEVAGSVRRKKETSKDIDILVSGKTKDRSKFISAFTKLGKVINVGDKKSSIWFTLGENTIQADLLVVPDSSFGAALQYFTGSKAHNIDVRSKAQRLGYKVNEKGIFKGTKKIGGKNEEDIYNILNIEMPKPEDR